MMRSPVSHFCWSPQRLFAALKDAQAREKESWRHQLMSDAVDKAEEVGPLERDFAVTHMAKLSSRCNFHLETFFLAVHCLDRFLHAVKSPPKYLKCIAVTSLYIASKIIEEEEFIPGTLELIEISECDLKAKDVLRMERIIVRKLEWDFHCPTPLTYLDIFHSLAFSSPIIQSNEDCSASKKSFQLSYHLEQLSMELQDVVCNSALVSFPSAAIALALLSLEMEDITSDYKQWVTIVTRLQGVAKIPSHIFLSCRNVLLSFLPRKSRYNPVGQVANQCQTKNYDTQVTERKSNNADTLPYQGSATKRKSNSVQCSSIPVSEHVKMFQTHNPDCNMDEVCDQCDIEAQNEPHMPELASKITSTSQGIPAVLVAQTHPPYSNTVTTYDGAAVLNAIESRQNKLQTTHTCDKAYYDNDILIDSVVSEDGDWNVSSPQEDDADSDGYDSDKTLTASEGEDEDYFERKKRPAKGLRPLTYAEIVKRGITETVAF